MVSLSLLVALYYSKHKDLERQNIVKTAYSKSVLPARHYCPIYVNRHNETRDLMAILDFHSSAIQIVGVVGSPSFGKSCLAINVGHDVVQQGVVVNFVNLRDVSDVDTLATKILDNARVSHSGFSSPKSALLHWLGQLNVYTLLVLDDCDDFLHLTKLTEKRYKEFETFIVNVANISSVCPTTSFFKVLLTSKTTPFYLSALLSAPFEEVEVKELQFEHADDMIASMVPALNSSVRFAIANLTGNSPLALRITGALLTRRHPVDLATVLSQLENDPIPFLTPDELNLEKLKPVGTSINVSYMYLDPEHQRYGRLLANFPGSFRREAAHAVLASEDSMQTYRRLTLLVEGSLLEYDKDAERYIFHRLIKAFFVYVQQKLLGLTGADELKEFKAQFFHYYTENLHTLTHLFTSSELLPSVKGFGSEDHNFIYLLENFADVPNVVNHSTADGYMHIAAHAFVTKFLPNNIATQYLVQPLKVVVDHFQRKIKGNITLNSESLILYGELVNVLASISGIQLSELKKSFPVTCRSPDTFQSTIDYAVFVVCHINDTSPAMDRKSGGNLPTCDALHLGKVGMAYYRNAEYGKAVFYISSFLNSSSMIRDAVEDSEYFYHLYRAFLKAGNAFSEAKLLVEEHPITKRYLSGKFDISMSRESYDWIATIISYLWATKRPMEAISVQNQLLAFRIKLNPWIHEGGKKFDLHENCMIIRHAIYEGSVTKNYSGAIALIENAMERFQKRSAGDPVYMGTPCITTERDIDGYFYSLFYYGKALISSRHFAEGVVVIEYVMDGILDMKSWNSGPNSHCFNQLLSLVCSYRIYEGDLICVKHILSSFLRSLHAAVVEGKTFNPYSQVNHLESAFHCVCHSSGAYFADSVSTMQWLPFTTTFKEVCIAFIIVIMQSVIVVLILYCVFRVIITTCSGHFILAVALGVVAFVWISLSN